MKFYLLNPSGVPPNPHLFPMFIETWKNNGVEIVDDIRSCDVVLMDFHSRLVDYKQSDIDYVVNTRVPIATFDEWDRGGLSDDKWPRPVTFQIGRVFHEVYLSKRDIHFCRLFNKNEINKYENVFPYEKPILHEEPMLTVDELFNREYDIVFIANHAPQREHLKNVLELNAKLKCKIILGAEKIPFQDWVNEHKKGKFFVKWSAGGYGCEKAQNLFSVAAMIKEDNDQLLLHDWTHCENSIKLSPNPKREEIETLIGVLNNKEMLYTLYRSNYEFMKRYYSKEYIATDILNKIKCHIITD